MTLLVQISVGQTTLQKNELMKTVVKTISEISRVLLGAEFPVVIIKLTEMLDTLGG
jgi:hypothetical protein